MLAKVHQFFNQMWADTGFSLERIRQNILDANPSASISVSKLHRIFSDPNSKPSFEDVIMITRDGFKRDPNELWAIIGGQEYAASAQVDYKGAAALIAEHNAQLAALEARYEAQLERGRATREGMQLSFTLALDEIKQSHAADLQHRDSTYDRVVKHLTTQLEDAVSNSNKSEEKYGAAMKSVKWWRILSVSCIAFIMLIIFYLIYELSDLSQGLTGLLIRMAKEGLL